MADACCGCGMIRCRAQVWREIRLGPILRKPYNPKRGAGGKPPYLDINQVVDLTRYYGLGFFGNSEVLIGITLDRKHISKL